MNIDILSLFPNYFQSPLETSFLKRAQEQGLIDVNLHDIRQYTKLKHQQVDDRPFGGGPGMLLRPEPVCDAIRSIKKTDSHVVYMSPKGKPLTPTVARSIAQHKNLVILCGHYEGVDQRAIDLEVDEEISIGDYVLTNGCLAALVLVDSMMRFIPGLLGDSLSFEQDSFENGLLDCPHYTRPSVFEDLPVPKELLSGNHQEISSWREAKSRQLTFERRPDLWTLYKEDQEDANSSATLCTSVNISHSDLTIFKEIAELITGAQVSFVKEDLLLIPGKSIEIFVHQSSQGNNNSLSWSIESHSLWNKIKRKLPNFAKEKRLTLIKIEPQYISFRDSCGLCWTLSLKT